MMTVTQNLSADVNASNMPQSDIPQSNGEDINIDRLTMLAHDLRNYFHVAELSLHVLRDAYRDDVRFSELLEIMKRDHQLALPQLNELIALAASVRENQDGESKTERK